MNRLKTLVIDDEPLARKGLAIRLQAFEQLQLMPECKSSRKPSISLSKINLI